MPTMKEAASEFLAHKRIAVTGVSRKPTDHGSNTVFKRLRDRGYEVFTVVRECAAAGVKRVWMHRSYGHGSVSAAATAYGREHGITVIDGGCPLMFDPTADVGHKVMRVVFAGHVPKTV